MKMGNNTGEQGVVTREPDKEVLPQPEPASPEEKLPKPESEPKQTRLGKVVALIGELNQKYTDYITKKQERLTKSDELFAKRMLAQAEEVRARTELTLASAEARAVRKTAKGIAMAKARQELAKEVKAAEEAKKSAVDAEIARKNSDAHNKVAKKLAGLNAKIALAEKQKALVEARRRAIESSAAIRNQKVSQGGKSWLNKLDLLSGSYRKYIIAAGVAAVAIGLLVGTGDISMLSGFEIDAPTLDVPDLGISPTDAGTPGVEGMDATGMGGSVPGTETMPTGPESIAPTGTDFFMQDSVTEHVIGTGEGITHGILELKETWPAGTDMPGWLENIDTPSEAAEWAQKNHLYNPDVAQDSLLMHKGEVLGIDAQGNLQIRYLNGDIRELTDSLGNVKPDALSGRVFTDTVASGALSVPTEISADTLTQIYSSAESFGNASVSYFAEPNPFNPGTSSYGAWEDIVSFLNTGGDTSWQKIDMPLIEFLQKFGGTR